MVRLFLTFLCWWASFFRSRHDLALQIISLRQQLIVLKRKNPRPRLSPMGSAVLGCVATLLVEMGRGVNPRETGDGSELASRRVSPLLDGQELPPISVRLFVAWPARIPSGEHPGFMANC